ncbi:hypothetical protein C0992_012855 [Termitomyces sp. T32_za158]|nr:hypothetical protein C0992_012855 [Termitomyces sp. T32_za158]
MASSNSSPTSSSASTLSTTSVTGSIVSATVSSSGVSTNLSSFAPSSSATAPGGSGGGGGNRDASTSATLYLYTFLATLVLLLSVSAAIILRSLFLRRRHQRMVDEAIRNGTWVPPSPGSGAFSFGNNGRRIDLSKKPALWEAFVGSGERHTQRTGKAEAVTEWEWDSIRPFAAAYVTPPNQVDSESATSNAIPQERSSLTARLHGLMRNQQQPTLHIPTRIRATTPITVPAATLPDSTAPPPAAPGEPASPQKVRVAVLIAMPQPPEAKSRSPTPQPAASTSATATPPRSIADEDQELPHIEFGVAELEVSLPHNKSDRSKEVRSSVASGSSVV